MLEKLKELFVTYKKPILFVGGAFVAWRLWKKFGTTKGRY
jgi:hypothetical protein